MDHQKIKHNVWVKLVEAADKPDQCWIADEIAGIVRRAGFHDSADAFLKSIDELDSIVSLARIALSK